MTTNKTHIFNIESIVNEVEKVIQNGLNEVLADYMDRYKLLEIKLKIRLFEHNYN
jgi:hypothetical protein